MKTFDQLNEREILALAISSEEEDGRTYADFAHGMQETHLKPLRSSLRWRSRRMGIVRR